MSREDKVMRDNCTAFQEKIFEYVDAGVPINDDISIKNHIIHCKSCQSFLENITLLKNHMLKPPLEDFEPDPRILETVISSMPVTKRFQKANLTVIWNFIRTFFEYRIPVYQALGGLMVVLMFFIVLNGSDPRGSYIENRSNQGSITSSELYVLDTLNLEKFETGQNAKEDSVLVSFLVPTM